MNYTVTEAELRMAEQTLGYWVQQKEEAEKKIAALTEFLNNVKVS